MPSYTVQMWGRATSNNQFYRLESKTDCALSKFVKLSAYSFASFTILTIALITIELYLAVVRPFVYEHRYNKQYFLFYLFSSWFLLIGSNTVMLYALPILWNTYKSFVVSWLCILVFLLIIVFHTLLSIEVGKLNRTATVANPFFNRAIARIHNREYQNKNNNKNHNRANRKTFRMTSTIIAAFSLCYLPLSIAMLYQIFHPPSMTSYNDVVITYVMPWCEVIALCNSALDPLIYCFRMRCIRHKIIQMVWPRRFRKVKDVNNQKIINRNRRRIGTGTGGTGGQVDGSEWGSNLTPKHRATADVVQLFQRQVLTE